MLKFVSGNNFFKCSYIQNLEVNCEQKNLIIRIGGEQYTFFVLYYLWLSSCKTYWKIPHSTCSLSKKNSHWECKEFCLFRNGDLIIGHGWPNCKLQLVSHMRFFKPLHESLWVFQKIIFVFISTAKCRNIVKWYCGYLCAIQYYFCKSIQKQLWCHRSVDCK